MALGDGAEVVVTAWVPDAPRATFLVLPAMGVPARYYEPLGDELSARGYAVVTADWRGLGTSSVRPGRAVDFGYARLVEDVVVIAAAVRARVPGPLHALGHSLGGQVGTLLAGAHPGVIDGLVVVAAGTPHWRRYPMGVGLRVLALTAIIAVVGPLLGYYPGRRVGFGGDEARQLMTEWSGVVRTGRFTPRGLDVEDRLPEARLDVLGVTVEGDWMAPPHALEHLLGKLASARVTRAHVTGAGLDHFKWARRPREVVDVVEAWARGREVERGVATGG